jgi:hypothetical protein
MDGALSEALVVAQGPFLRFSLFPSLLAGNLVRRPVRQGLRRQAGSLVRTSLGNLFVTALASPQ